MATDAKNNPCTPSRHTGKHARCINTVIGQTEEAQQLGQKARLSPLFVEWMMGFPTGWTDLKLPTPTANEAKNNPGTPSQWNRNDSLNVEAAKAIGHTKETIGNDMRLNPLFVEWMMGFPTGWTDLEL
jgi:hypothetical protein